LYNFPFPDKKTSPIKEPIIGVIIKSCQDGISIKLSTPNSPKSLDIKVE